MGYGFSLAHNPAEHCVLALAPQHKAKSDILDAENSAVQSRGHKRPSYNGGHKQQLESVHWIRLRNDTLDKDREDESSSFVFSPGFLSETAAALSNTRERARNDLALLNQVDFSDPDLSRIKLKVMCVVAMLVQRRHAAIIQHDPDLPKSPVNQKQFHADRYRQDQLHILRSVNDELIDKLAGLTGLGSAKARDYRVVRMEHMLTESPKPVLKDYRAVLNAGLGSRNPTKIRERGLTECAFTLWICGIWLWGTAVNEKAPASGNRSFQDVILQWLSFLTSTYGDLLHPQKASEGSEASCGLADTMFAEDDLLLVESFLDAVTTAVKKNPKSIYNNSACTKERLLWCLTIAREESVMAPNLEGKLGDNNDELLLFLECGHEKGGT